MKELIRREERDALVLLHICTNSIDAVSAAALEAACAEAPPIIVLNFRDVIFINAAGIAVLLKFVVRMRKAGYKLFALNLSPHYQKVFKMVEMLRFMPTIEERDLAAYR